MGSSKKRRRPRNSTAFTYHGRSGDPNSLDGEAGSESEDATTSRGSRETGNLHHLFQYAESRDPCDDLQSRIGLLIRKHVEDVLSPLVLALQSREENEQKHRERLLRLEVEKLVLERKKLLFKQRRAAPHPGPYLRSNRIVVEVRKSPSWADQQDQAVAAAECGCLREKKTCIAGDETCSSSLLPRAARDGL